MKILLTACFLGLFGLAQTTTPNSGIFSTMENYYAPTDAGCAKAKNVTVSNGQLVISSQTEASLTCGPGANYSAVSKSFSYGVTVTQAIAVLAPSATHTVVTFRAKMGGYGLHTAGWLSGCAPISMYWIYVNCVAFSNANTGYGEIDIGEFKPSVSTTQIAQNTIDAAITACSNSTTLSDPSLNWHTYAADITSSTVQFLIDGSNSVSCSTHIPTIPFSLVFGISGMGTGQSALAPTANNIQAMTVDYVKITIGGVTNLCLGTGTGGGAQVCSQNWVGLPASAIPLQSN